jgi:hypothetical protein
MPFGSDSTLVQNGGVPCPWWVQALDLIAVGAAVTGVALLVRTGPRFWIGLTPISIQSPWRALAFAAAAATARHLLFLRPALHTRLVAQLLALARSRSLRSVATPFVASRGAVLLAAYLALLTIGYPGDRPRPRFSDNEFLNLVMKWDAEWYYNIATDGYRWDDVSLHRARVVFFPGYPMLMRVAGWMTGNMIVGALLLSLAAFLWALTYLFRLAREDLGEADAATAVLLLAFYPFSLFYGTVYTESLFLLAAVGGLYHFRRREWVKASAWGLVVGVARPNGFLLSVVLAASLAERVFRARREGTLDAREWRRVAGALLVAAMPVVGTAAYSGFCWSLTGDPLMWMRLQVFWGRGDQTLLQMLGDRYTWIAQKGFFGYLSDMPIDFVNLCAGAFAIAAIWPVFRRLGLACAVFVALNVLPPVLSGTPLSLARMTSTLFPLFMWLAVSIRSDRRTSLIGAFATLQGFFAVLFFTWRRFY